MPQVKITVTGNIKDFDRLDNVYRTFKRETDQALDDWVLQIDVDYTEKKGEGE